MDLSWFIFAVVAGLGSVLFNSLNRKILKDSGDSTAYAWFFEIVRLTFFAFFAFFSFYTVISPSSIFSFIFIGIIEIISVYLFMRMHKINYLSISTIIQRSRVIWVAILAFIFLNERLDTVEYLGILVLFIGLSIIASPKKIKTDKGIQTAFLSAIVIPFNSINIKYLSSFSSSSVIMIMMSLPSVFALPIIMRNGISRIKRTLSNNLLLKLIASFANTASMFFYVAALERGPVSKVIAIYQGMTIITVIVGIVFLKEKENAARKLLGILVTLAGVYLVSLF